MSYKKLEYIESTGTQYIDSEFVPTSNTKVVFKFSEKGSTNGVWFGAYPNTGEWEIRSFGLYQNHVPSQQFWMHYCSNTSSSLSQIIYESVITLSKDGLYMNDTKLCSTNNNTFTSDNTMYIFSGHGNSTNNQPMAGRIHYFKIWESDILVRDFRPALDENEVPCFFDEVSQTYFYNIGEGDFIAGDRIFDVRYLIRSNNILYTVIDDNLTELQETILTSDIFRTYGVEEIPEWDMISHLTNPEILYWQDSGDTEPLPEIHISQYATPPPQIIISEKIDLTDISILGIESATVTSVGDVRFAVSFNDRVTWKVWNGTEWTNVTDEFSGMTKELFESITSDAWQTLYAGATDFYIRVVLTSCDQSVSKIYIKFINE